ncbi:hypothetical protein QCA50_012377 [Cerrena zonata]|uniref:FH2 domain-containing protein n=1 Tax=Cerrena zonata TaxID=2478898 RepID=A0AAW0G5Z6_9APHY
MIVNIFYLDCLKLTYLRLDEIMEAIDLREKLASLLQTTETEIEDIFVVPPGTIPFVRDIKRLHEIIQLLPPTESLGHMQTLQNVFAE